MKTLSTHEVAERLRLPLRSAQRALLRDKIPVAETVQRTNYYRLSDIKAFEQLRAKRAKARSPGPKPGSNKESK